MNVEILPGLDPRQHLEQEAARFADGGEHTLLWRSAPCVVIGRNQCAEEEVSAEGLREVPVLRRTTGGGAVYHDPNNINFSFIRQESLPGPMQVHVAPILRFLRQLGLPVVFSGRNDILLCGRKISGCAMRHDDGRTLVHGTLLFRRDADKMARYLTPDSEKLLRHGVASVAVRTGELAPYLSAIPDAEAFLLILRDFLDKNSKPETSGNP